MTDPWVYFCPLQTDSHYQFASPTNPWPIKAFNYFNINYCVRPMVNAVPNSVGLYYPSYTTQWTRTSKLDSYDALAADLTPQGDAVHYYSYFPGHINKWVNVFYVDCSVDRLPYAVYQTSYGNGVSVNFLTGGTPPTGMWIDYDNYHK